MNARPPFVCPVCRGELEPSTDAYRCRPCAATYPVALGLADFRIAADPWITPEDDRRKGVRLDALSAGASFAETVRIYWSMTPETSPELANRFVAHVLAAETRSREWLAGLPPAPPGPWLDLGCGTADLAAAAPPDVSVTSIDVAFRWLVAARKRLEEADRPPGLVCGNAEALPFPDQSFAQVLSLGMLEHTAAPDAVFREARRVLMRGGVLRFRSVNRYSPLPEPHVNVWGVGFVPRRWADAYVRAVSGRRYLHHRPCSPREIRAGLRRAGFGHVQVAAARLLPTERARLRGAAQSFAGAYAALAERPASARAAAWTAPILDVSATAV